MLTNESVMYSISYVTLNKEQKEQFHHQTMLANELIISMSVIYCRMQDWMDKMSMNWA